MWPIGNTFSTRMDKDLMEQAFLHTGSRIIKAVEPSGDSLANCVVSSSEIFAALGAGTVCSPANLLPGRMASESLLGRSSSPPHALGPFPVPSCLGGGVSQLTWRASTTPGQLGCPPNNCFFWVLYWKPGRWLV